MMFAISASVQTLHHHHELDSKSDRMEQFGGGGSLEDQCGSITFEDIFIYNQAIFEVRVNDDWKSAEVDAKAWINWSLSDDIREDLDAFLEDIVPSGGDGWLSTDEIDAMVSIAADCLEYSITRIGIRDGAPHRGGEGVSWMNTTWEDGQTNIGHLNGVPTRHSQLRDCQGFSQDGCVEVPVIPDSERDCDIEINESLGADECRIELWLNATMVIEGVSDPNDFTIAFNSSNMSNARLDFTFPVMPDLRMDMWEECEGRFVGVDEENPGTDSAPIRGSCIGDGTASYELLTNDDGSLTYSLESNFSREEWPLGEDVFADFTTSPIPTDEAPTWTQQAPMNGTWIPVVGEGANKLSSWEGIASWFDDESGVSNLDVVCNSGGNEISQSIDGSLWINVDGVTEISCEAKDASGKSSGNRTWQVGVPVSISTPEVILQDQHPLIISHSDSWGGDVIVRLALSQGGQPSEIQEFHKGNSSQQAVDLSPQGIIPGPVNVWVEVLVGQFSFQHIIDLGIVKESAPPSMTIGSGEFEGKMWRVGGQYSDPDGEPVTFTIEVDDQEIGNIMVSGNTWESEWIDLSVFSLGIIEVDVTGCDHSGKCTTSSTTVDISLVMEELLEHETPDDIDEVEESILPFAGIPSLTIAISVAILFRGRRE
ncbi:MAG: hypothetical protein CND84_01885 [Marine Group II euryarchaeote MED-G35]|nr:MAG: hypothetical protein CND84_01885 [Marine Group II euryarchaeote MED-G35]